MKASPIHVVVFVLARSHVGPAQYQRERGQVEWEDDHQVNRLGLEHASERVTGDAVVSVHSGRQHRQERDTGERN